MKGLVLKKQHLGRVKQILLQIAGTASNIIENIDLERGTLLIKSFWTFQYAQETLLIITFFPPSVKAYKQKQVVLERRWHYLWSQVSEWESGDSVSRFVLHHLPTTISCEIPRTTRWPKDGTSHQQWSQKAGTGNSVWIWNANQEHIPKPLSVLAGAPSDQ